MLDRGRVDLDGSSEAIGSTPRCIMSIEAIAMTAANSSVQAHAQPLCDQDPLEPVHLYAQEHTSVFKSLIETGPEQPQAAGSFKLIEFAF